MYVVFFENIKNAKFEYYRDFDTYTGAKESATAQLKFYYENPEDWNILIFILYDKI